MKAICAVCTWTQTAPDPAAFITHCPECGSTTWHFVTEEDDD